MFTAMTRMSARTLARYALLYIGVAGLFINTGSIAAEPIPVSSKSFFALAIYPLHNVPATVVSDNHNRISAEIRAPFMQ